MIISRTESDTGPLGQGTQWIPFDASLHLLKLDFRANVFSRSHLTEPIIEHVSGNLTWSIYLPIHPVSHQSPGPPCTHRLSFTQQLNVCVCVWWTGCVGGCEMVWVCPALTPTELADMMCFVRRQQSRLLVDILNGAEARRREFWINTGKARCPVLSFAWTGRVRRPNTMLLRRYYLYYL